MRHISLFWKLYYSYLLVSVLALIMVLAGAYTVGILHAPAWTSAATELGVEAPLGFPSIVLGGCLLVLLSAAIGLFTSGRIIRPLQVMQRGAERFAAGDFRYGLPVPDTAELGSLSITLNRMAAQLAAQIGVITQQRNEQEAILASMHEGVLAL